ncbi:MAG: type I methionyl aminopeptidase [Actinomycetota bacterium]
MPRDHQTGFLTPGTISKPLLVPNSIVRPEYVGKKAPAEWLGSHIKTPEQIELIRHAGKIAAGAIAEAGRAAEPGITTDQLDKIVHEYVLDHGAYPSTLGYRGFPKSCCTSINEVICHGIPDDTKLQEGDIVNIDVTAYIDGYHGDSNRTFLVGQVSEAASLLVQRTEEALNRATSAVLPGRAINTIGRTIESYAKRFDYGVVRDFTGHGIGEAFHSGLVIPHFDAAPNYSLPIEVGMVFTIEPMLTLGTHEWDIWEDGWTVTTKDKTLTAQFEHTLVVTESGAEILTLP